nr:kinase [Actinoplanes rishiriensis]
MLREHGSNSMPTVAPGFIMTAARAALEAGYHVVLEGILHTGQYGGPLRDLIAEHAGLSFTYWLDVSFDETVRRHRRRPEPIPVTAEDMRAWYTPLDLLGVAGEQVIDEASGFEDTVSTILHHSRLAEAAALTPCPRLCLRCAEKRSPGTAPAGGAAPENAGRAG